MPAFYRFMGFGFVAVLILIAGAMIGAVLYETHISSEEPGNFWSRWQAVVGSFGVLAAIGVAIFTDVKVDRRFEKQIETQTELDRRADERQQAEWNKRADQAKDERNFLRRSIRLGMIAELGACIQRAQIMIEELRDETSTTRLVGHIDNFRPFRPVYQHMGNSAVLLNSRVIAAITAFEPGYDERLKLVQNVIEAANENDEAAKVDIHWQQVAMALEAYVLHAQHYQEKLEKVVL